MIRFGLVVFVALALDGLIRAYGKRGGATWIAYALAVLLTAGIVVLAAPPDARLHDFDKAYYHAGSKVLAGDADLYGAEGVQGFVNLPIVAVLFAPFAALPLPVSHVVFTTLGLWITVAAFRVLTGLARAHGHRTLMIAALFVINGPLMYSLQIGNNTQHVLLLLLLAAVALEKGREGWTGALVAVAAILKLPLLLLGGLFVVRWQWRALSAFLATLGVAVLLSLATFGTDEHVRWYQQIVAPFAGQPMVAYNVQSIDAAIARVMTAADLGEWLPVQVGQSFQIARVVALTFLAVPLGFVFLRRSNPSSPPVQLLELCIILCVAVVASPVSWTHYYLLLLLPLGLYYGGRFPVPERRLWRVMAGIAVVLISLPVRPLLILGYLGHSLTGRILVSHWLAGGLMLFVVLVVLRQREFASPGLTT